MQFFTEFFDAFAKSDKKTYKENLSPFFATADTCMDFCAEPYVKFDEKPADKWNDLLKNMFDDGRVQLSVLTAKEECQVIKAEAILVEQMREKKGG